MGTVLALTVNLESIDCGVCGGTYALNERYINQARAKGTGWQCPYCETSWGYFGAGTEEKARKALAAKVEELAAEKARHQTALRRANEAEAARLKAEGATKQLKKRVANGACPCCTRSFVNLQRHIATKHPEFKDKT